MSLKVICGTVVLILLPLSAASVAALAQSQEDKELESLQNYIAKAHTQDKANWNGTKTTIVSPAFGSSATNPNAILDTANQQAQALRAYGDSATRRPTQPTSIVARPVLVTNQQQPARIPVSADHGQTVVIKFTHSLTTEQGRAHVISMPSGIDCPTTCSANFGQGVDVRLSATADADSVVNPITCSWQADGSNVPIRPGNTKGCMLLSRFATGSGPEVVNIDVDIWGSGQKIITGNGLPPVPAQTATGNSTFPNTAKGQNCIPPAGYASCVDLSQNGGDFVIGSGALPSGSGVSGSVGGRCPGGTSNQCVLPLSPNCITSFWDSKYYGWLSFQNQCSQAINLQWVSRNNSGAWGGGGGAATIAAGGSTNIGQSPAEVNAAGGGYSLYVCPTGYGAIDHNGNPVRGPNVNYVCRKE